MYPSAYSRNHGYKINRPFCNAVLLTQRSALHESERQRERAGTELRGRIGDGKNDSTQVGRQKHTDGKGKINEGTHESQGEKKIE